MSESADGYRVIDTVEEARWWLNTGRYFVARFAFSPPRWGLCAREGGGCWGILTDDVVRQLPR